MSKPKLIKKLRKEKKANKYGLESIALLSKEVRELKRMNKNAISHMVDSGHDIADLVIERDALKEKNKQLILELGYDPEEEDVFYTDAEQIALLHAEVAEQKEIVKNHQKGWMEMSTENDKLQQEKKDLEADFKFCRESLETTLREKAELQTKEKNNTLLDISRADVGRGLT